MDTEQLPHRCPSCNAMVVDRRSPVCTTCRVALPKEWIMPPKQVAKMMKIDRACNAASRESARTLGSPMDIAPDIST